jgi:hypothetical protein
VIFVVHAQDRYTLYFSFQNILFLLFRWTRKNEPIREAALSAAVIDLDAHRRRRLRWAEAAPDPARFGAIAFVPMVVFVPAWMPVWSVAAWTTGQP